MSDDDDLFDTVPGQQRRVTVPGLGEVDRNVTTPYEEPQPSALNRELFNWFSPTPRTDEPEPPPRRDVEERGFAAPAPPGPLPPEWFMFANADMRPWEEPRVFSEPFHTPQTANIPFFEQATPIFQYDVPDMWMLTVTGVSYEIDNTVLPPNSFFVVEVLRSEQVLASWTEFTRNNAAPNPGDRYTFAGHYRPMPFYGRFDRGEHLTVRVRIRGPKPFVKTPADPFNGDCKILLYGHLDRLLDTREGAPKGTIAGTDQYVVDARRRMLKDMPRMIATMALIDEYEQRGKEDDDGMG